MLDNLYLLHLLLLFHLVAEHIQVGAVVGVRYIVSFICPGTVKG
jgi:hypothetical protein